jgi:hypothetical protein
MLRVESQASISVRSLSPFGERVGVRGLQNQRESLTPHPTPLPMGEGAERVCCAISAKMRPIKHFFAQNGVREMVRTKANPWRATMEAASE